MVNLDEPIQFARPARIPSDFLTLHAIPMMGGGIPRQERFPAISPLLYSAIEIE
ncbi:MAG TPA: hypothetical protein VEL11_00360 [Candidatus Bathyarchaeia archaeon]|nr:hypothetical protein [Candidatus Bathyarchaeia archaeon]